MSSMSLPVLSGSEGLSRYLREIQRFPMLSVEEEYALAKNWRDNGDIQSAQKLVTSHLKLVAKIAVQFKGYGLPLLDLISEGTIGLMKAVKKFEPELGYRLSTYAMWWIKASIQDYILKSWSMVKIGTSSMQKKLFFNIRKIKSKLVQMHCGNGDRDYNADIAEELGVGIEHIESMTHRLSPNSTLSINDTIGDESSELELGETLLLSDESHEASVIAKFDNKTHLSQLTDAISVLDDRERYIILNRRLSEKPVTFEQLSAVYNISKERVRQIEERAIAKLKKAMCG